MIEQGDSYHRRFIIIAIVIGWSMVSTYLNNITIIINNLNKISWIYINDEI